MRIESKPEDAQYARVGEVEFQRSAYDHKLFYAVRVGNILTETAQKLGATFERDLPEVGDGKEYEYKKGDGSNNAMPKQTRYWVERSGKWSDPDDYWCNAPNCIFAIPKESKSCVVEGRVDTVYASGILTKGAHSFQVGDHVLCIPKDKATVLTGYKDSSHDLSVLAEKIGEIETTQGKRVTVIVVEEQ